MRESEFKESWDLDEGAMYLPWNNLPKDLAHFLDGAIIDGASLPEHLKGTKMNKQHCFKDFPAPGFNRYNV